MFENEDEGTRIGLFVTIGILFLVLMGVIGGVVLRQMNLRAAPAAVVAEAPAAAASGAEGEEALLDVPLTGDLVATLYFEVDKAELPADAASAVAQVSEAMAAAPARKAVLSGFHDASGDPAHNAELAKQRAIAVRGALTGAGLDAARVLLRKPESTTGDGTMQEARRVEVRLVE